MDLSDNSLRGTIPNNFGKLKNMYVFSVRNNYLTMGTARTVPVRTFSGKTLYYLGISEDNGMRDNCFAFYHDKVKINVTESRCINSSK